MSKFEVGELLERKQVYEGKIVDLVVDRIRISGMETVREVVRHPGGVVVLAEVEGKGIPFVRQHRYPMDEDLLELPAGKIDPGEDPAESAGREFEEETGYRAGRLTPVCSFYTSPGFCDELLHFYFAEDLTPVAQNTEPDEDLELVFCSLEEALEMVSRGEIRDAKTVSALFWMALERQRRASGD